MLCLDVINRVQDTKTRTHFGWKSNNKVSLAKDASLTFEVIFWAKSSVLYVGDDGMCFSAVLLSGRPV